MQPPIVPGLTQTAQTASSKDLLATLAGQSNGPPTTGSQLLRQGVQSFYQAGQMDPRLSQRIQKALAIVEGTDEASDRARQSGGADAFRTGPMLGTAKTPI